MSAPTRQKLFTLWFGLGHPPLVAGAVLIGFSASVYMGVVTVLMLVAHLYASAHTTCRRCAFYGTAKCGLPGLVVPLIFAKVPAASLSRARVQTHFLLDLSFVVFLNGIYCLQPWLLPLPLIWSVGVWLISLGPKRYHGLLYRLRRPEGVNPPRISLPVVEASADQDVK